MSRAIAVETAIVEIGGRWAVDLIVIMEDGVIRHRIDTYHSERLAVIHARYLKRGAERDIGGGTAHG
jgi:hypothetical protein